MKTDLAWHATEAHDVLSALEVDGGNGLSTEEHEKRLKQFGPNKFEKKERFRLLKLIWEQIANPLVIILVVSGIITYFLGEKTDTIVIYFAITVNTIVGVYQEGSAGRAFEKLKSSVKKFAVVKRDGARKEVEAETLVPGDIVVLESGDQIPADIRFFDTKALVVNEAILTGEWMPVPKSVNPTEEKTRITEQHDMGWMGTLVEDGSARGVVVGTGEHTELGKIASMLKEEEREPTPFQIGLAKLGKFITWMIMAIIAVIFILGILEGDDIVTMFITSVAIAVAAIPEGLPVAVTVILAVGMTHTLRKGGLIKKLVKAETLGSTTVIVTDKTGTLTKGEMNFAGAAGAAEIAGGEHQNLKGMNTNLSENQRFTIRTGVFTSNAFIENADEDPAKWIIRGRPTDRALLTAAGTEHMVPKQLFSEEPRADHLPFESERRFAASLNTEQDGRKRLYITGALEFILPLCHSQRGGDGSPVDLHDRDRVMGFYAASTGEGMRVLATAYKDVDGDAEIPRKDFGEALQGLVFTGVIGFHDPVRPDVAASIAEAKQAGLRTVMVTGDHENTALAVAREVGLEQTQEAIRGEQLDTMSEEELKETIKTHQVFARVLPSQKVKIANAFKDAGETVAMTGDGVNDAPAIKAADIGIAVGSGTDVAKEASDLVLLKDSFSIIVSSIESGRVVVDNLRKVLAFLLAANWSEIALIAGALLLKLPLPVLPMQILWANIVEEGFMNFALAFEPKEDDVMKRTHAQLEPTHLINKEMKFLIFAVGAFTSIILAGLYLYLLDIGYPIEDIRTIMFAGLCIDALFFVFSLKSLRKPLWKINIFNNRYLLIAFGMSTLFLVAGLTFPPLESLLKTVTPTLEDTLLIVGLGVVDLVCIEIGKYIYISRNLA